MSNELTTTGMPESSQLGDTGSTRPRIEVRLENNLTTIRMKQVADDIRDEGFYTSGQAVWDLTEQRDALADILQLMLSVYDSAGDGVQRIADGAVALARARSIIKSLNRT